MCYHSKVLCIVRVIRWKGYAVSCVVCVCSVPANNYTETPNSYVTSTKAIIAYQPGSTPLDCQNLCSTYDECGYAVFTFQSLTCFLYTAVGSSVEASYFDSSTYTRTIYIASSTFIAFFSCIYVAKFHL
jgi:hypothetical protein